MPSTADLESRLDRLEATLERVVQLLETRSTPFTQSSRHAQAALSELYGQDELQERMSELVLRLGEPDTLEALTRIGVLLPSLEYALQAAAGGPELLEEGLEMVRAEFQRRGVDAADLDARTRAAGDALSILTQPSTLKVLGRLASSLTGAVPLAEALGRASDEVRRVEGPGFEQRLEETFSLLVQAETLDSLGRIAALAPQIEYAVNALAAGPELLEEGMAMVQEKLQREGADAAELQLRVRAATDAVMACSSPAALRALSQIGAAGSALTPFVRAAARTGRMLSTYEGQDALTDRLAESFLRIAEPETLDALTRVACLTPQIEFAVNALAAGPEILEEVMEQVRTAGAKSGLTPHDINRRVQTGLEALTALSDPTVLKALGKVDVPGMLEFTEVIARPANKEALLKLVDLAPALERPLSALPVQPNTLDILRAVNEAVEEVSTQKRSIGLFGLLSAIRDPNVQRALGFFLSVAERVGEHLDERPKLNAGT
ncbi:MAG: DUF1641 domain-containing protein [Myxococcota bacterium]